jgi:hypothetical protein
MIALIAGMPRSGSTFSFNIAREVLLARGTLYQEPSDDLVGALSRAGSARHVLLKCHALTAASMAMAKADAMPVVITTRRIEDAIASWLTTFEELPESEAITTMRNWLQMYRDLRSQAVIVRYEQIDRYPWLAAWRIARAVCPTVGPLEVMRIARRFGKAAVKRRTDALNRGAPAIQDMGWSYYDTRSFLHRRHISEIRSRRAEERLSAERLERFRQALRDDIAACDLSNRPLTSRISGTSSV